MTQLKTLHLCEVGHQHLSDDTSIVALLLCTTQTYTRHAVGRNHNPVNDLMIKNLAWQIRRYEQKVTKGQKIYFRDLTKVVFK